MSIKLRFSLRCLLVLTACFAALCYWQGRPRRRAERFVAAIRADDYQAAGAMIASDYGHSFLCDAPGDSKAWSATTVEQTMDDWLAGRCVVLLSTKVHAYTLSCQIEFTRTGAMPATHMRMEEYAP